MPPPTVSGTKTCSDARRKTCKYPLAKLLPDQQTFHTKKKEPHGESHIPPTWAYPREENPESL